MLNVVIAIQQRLVLLLEQPRLAKARCMKLEMAHSLKRSNFCHLHLKGEFQESNVSGCQE